MGERREEIVAAALELLAEVPVDRLTTRAVAERVGVSQPALFRHFACRDEILSGVVATVTASLREELHRIISGGSPPQEAATELARALFGLSSRHPGIPALFLHDTAQVGREDSARTLDHLSAMPVAFAAELVRIALRDGSLEQPVDADAAGRLFAALIQGELLQARRDGRRPEPDREAARVVGFWWAGLRGGQPAADPERESPTPGEGLLALDVRPVIAGGDDPLDLILRTLNRLRPDGVLVLTAPFRPEPLLALLGARGWRAHERKLVDDPDGHVLEFVRQDGPGVFDLTELEAPEPMHRVLERAARLTPGDPALFRLPRRPEPLLALLEERPVEVELVSAPDGVTLLLLRSGKEPKT